MLKPRSSQVVKISFKAKQSDVVAYSALTVYFVKFIYINTFSFAP